MGQDSVPGLCGRHNSSVCAWTNTKRSRSTRCYTTIQRNNRGQKITLGEGEGFEKASLASLDELLSFSQLHTDGLGSWLKDYLSHWVGQEAVYCLRDERQLVATGELRPSLSQPGVADIGVIVHGDYRGKGTATRVLKALIHEGWMQQWTLIALNRTTKSGRSKSTHPGRSGDPSPHGGGELVENEREIGGALRGVASSDQRVDERLRRRPGKQIEDLELPVLGAEGP